MGSYAVRVRDVHKKFSYSRHKNNSLKRAITQVFKKKDRGEDEFYALNGISFDVEKGDFFGILGRNGSGKSTLLKIISEIYRPTNGSVQHHGKLVSFIELGVGFKAELSGRENVYLNGAMLGFSKDEIDEMYDDIVAFAELEKFMDQTLKNYSSGMKVRLAFSVAIRAKADILVLDEVLAVGDADFQRKCYDYFTSLKEQEKTIIFVSHSMSAVKQYCNKAVLIEDGKVAFEGSGEDAANEYLKLFNRSRYEKEKAAREGKEDRFGSGEIKIKEVSVEIDDDELTLGFSMKSYESVKNVVVGVDVYDHNDKLVGGVDDTIQRQHKFNMAKDEDRQFEYRFKNLFGGGEYTVTLGVRSADNSQIYDFWRKAARFTNTVDVGKHFPVTLPVDITEK